MYNMTLLPRTLLGLNCVPLQFYVEALTPQCEYLEIGTFGK